MRAVILERSRSVSSASGDDDDEEEPSVAEQLSEIAQMLRTMQFDITALKRSNRRA